MKGSADTQGKGSVLAWKAVQTHRAKAVSLQLEGDGDTQGKGSVFTSCWRVMETHRAEAVSLPAAGG